MIDCESKPENTIGTLVPTVVLTKEYYLSLEASVGELREQVVRMSAEASALRQRLERDLDAAQYTIVSLEKKLAKRKRKAANREPDCKPSRLVPYPRKKSVWRCYLFGSTPDCPVMVYQPAAGTVPNRFVRWMMKVFFACQWVRGE